jgi:hypothetical protein
MVTLVMTYVAIFTLEFAKILAMNLHKNIDVFVISQCIQASCMNPKHTKLL